MSQKSNFTGGRELEEARQQNPSLGNLLRRMVGAINNMANSAGVSATGKAAAPPNIGALNVKASGEIVHLTISDTSPIQKPIEYFIEHSTEPNFTNPYVVHLVSSRNAFLNLPSKTDGGASQKWYFRAYSQQLGSDPSTPVYYGGKTPVGITLSGSTQLTPLTSTGSGTASNTGGQGGWGRGKVQQRAQQGTTRQ